MRFNSSCSATHLFISLLFLFQLPKHNYSSFDHSPQALDSLLWHASSSAVNPQKKRKPHGMQPSASPFFYIIYILPALLPTLYKMILRLPLLKATSFQWMQPFMPFQAAIFSWFPLAVMVFHHCSQATSSQWLLYRAKWESTFPWSAPCPECHTANQVPHIACLTPLSGSFNMSDSSQPHNSTVIL